MKASVVINTPAQIAQSKVAGKLAAEVLAMIGEHVKAGVTTDQLDASVSCPARRSTSRAPPGKPVSWCRGTSTNRSRLRSASVTRYSGSAGLCREKPLRLANSASFSWIQALSSRISRATSWLAGVVKTLPRKPSIISRGR